MLLDTPEAYVYGEKFYDQSYLISSLSIKIFKQQKHKSLNFNQFRMVITNQFYDEYFDEAVTEILNERKNEIVF